MEPLPSSDLPAWLAGAAALVPGLGVVAAVVIRAARLEVRLEDTTRTVGEARDELRELRAELRQQAARIAELSESLARIAERQEAIEHLRRR